MNHKASKCHWQRHDKGNSLTSRFETSCKNSLHWSLQGEFTYCPYCSKTIEWAKPEEVIRRYELTDYFCPTCGANIVNTISNISDTAIIDCPNHCEESSPWQSDEERQVFIERIMHGQIKVREIEDG